MMKGAKLYHLPTIEDRESAEMALQAFLKLQSGLARNIMLGALKALLTRYRLNKLNLSNCVIEINSHGVVIKPKKFIVQKVCPSCGEDLYGVQSRVRILSICPGNSSDVVTYGCHCGEIFGRVEST